LAINKEMLCFKHYYYLCTKLESSVIRDSQQQSSRVYASI